MRTREGVGTEVEILPDLSHLSVGLISQNGLPGPRALFCLLLAPFSPPPADQTLLRSIRVLLQRNYVHPASSLFSHLRELRRR